MIELGAARQARILEQLRVAGSVRVSDLTQLLGVSDMTVRRDLDALGRRGLLTKVHGGATMVETSRGYEPGFEAKSAQAQNEKEAIAQATASLVRPGSAIGITAGTTTWALASWLKTVESLTVVTNSPKVADVLCDFQALGQTIVLTGGIRTPSGALVGPVAVTSLRSLHLDQVIMGVHGIDVDAGLTTPNMMEAETNLAFAQAAARLVVVADHTKFGTVALSRITSLESVHTLVTDEGISPDARKGVSERVDRLIVAPLDHP